MRRKIVSEDRVRWVGSDRKGAGVVMEKRVKEMRGVKRVRKRKRGEKRFEKAI
jgi:hypothetical protein